MEYDYDELSRVLYMLYVCARMIEEGLWTTDEVDYTMDDDNFYAIVGEAIYSCCDLVSVEYKEDSEVTSYYFSDPCMMEYYRLCREYSRRRDIRLKDNPYMKKAQQYVYEQLHGDYNTYYILHTKVNHKYASGIHFMYDVNFNSEVELLDRLLNVFAFYREGVETLKAELSKPTALAVIYPSLIKAVAA